MKNSISSFFVGLMFALGLGLAGMTEPQKVIGFLDVANHWDPSLIFVMGGALITHSILYWLIRKRPSPIFSDQWYVPNKSEITSQLLIGASLFGLGWGIAGYCPAPAITSLASLTLKPFVFVITMIAGMLLYHGCAKWLAISK
jgi:uncharacterized membrane protein YedE/YeeE